MNEQVVAEPKLEILHENQALPATGITRNHVPRPSKPEVKITAVEREVLRRLAALPKRADEHIEPLPSGRKVHFFLDKMPYDRVKVIAESEDFACIVASSASVERDLKRRVMRAPFTFGPRVMFVASSKGQKFGNTAFVVMSNMYRGLTRATLLEVYGHEDKDRAAKEFLGNGDGGAVHANGDSIRESNTEEHVHGPGCSHHSEEHHHGESHGTHEVITPAANE